MAKQGAILCPNCRKLINADEPVCPYCRISRPGSAWSSRLWNLGGLRSDTLVPYVIYLNAGLYVVSLLLSGSSIGVSANPFDLLSPSFRALQLLGGTGTIPIDHFGRWWTVISANYLHGSLLHIFFNMAALHRLAPLVLREYGLNRMIALYTIGGIVGFVVSYLAGVRFTIGASAAVCSLIGAMLYYGKSRGGAYGQAVFQGVWGWTLGLFLFGLLVPGINNWGHGGGIAGGFVLGFVLGYQERGREKRYHKLLAVACVVSTVAVLGWAVATGLLLQFAR